MTKSVLQDWIKAEPDRAELYAREKLIVEVTEEIWSAMLAQSVTKKELADRLRKSKAYITQTLNGSRNMTLGTLADIALVLGRSPCFRLHRKHVSGAWHTFEPDVPPKQPIVSHDSPALDAPSHWGNIIPLRRKAASGS